jgi:hypothetical protein
MSNSVKQQYIDREEAKKTSNSENVDEVPSEAKPDSTTDSVVSKKTLQNRKKAEKKKEKMRAQKAATFNSV